MNYYLCGMEKPEVGGSMTLQQTELNRPTHIADIPGLLVKVRFVAHHLN